MNDSSTDPEDHPNAPNPGNGNDGDENIGRAFRRSVFYLVIALIAFGLSVWYSRHSQRRDFRQTDLTAPVAATNAKAKAIAEIPDVKFTDITTAAGLKFVHVNGAEGEKLLPETMGGGVAFLDFDGDGAQDLLFVNSTDWPWAKHPHQPAPTLALYRNDGHGAFTDVTAGSGLDVSFYGMGIAVADYDNDGRPDVFITAVGPNHLFHNEGGGKFKDVTSLAGVSGSADEWSTSAAWIDYDNDGKLDLFVCNYVRWSRAIDLEADYRLVGIGRAYGPPWNFPGTFPYLYHNDGNGKFSDVTARAGLQIRNPATGVPTAKSLGVAAVDIDGDGWIDMVVANDTVQNFVFTNRHDGTFAEVGARTGLAFDIYGQTRGAMGIDAARYRNDDALAIAIGNFANEPNALYVAQRDPLIFADEAITEGIGPASRLLLKFGMFFFDYDLDGRLDVLTANGHIEEEIGKVQAGLSYRQPAQLFWNSGSARGQGFVPVPSEKAGADLFHPIVGRGSAFADIDGDGDLDVVLTQINGPPLLLRNDSALPHHWIRLRLIGNAANRDGIGAWIKVRSGGRSLARQVMPTKGYLSASELPVTFGLGSADHVDDVTITWPGGHVQRVDGIRLDAVTEVREKQ